MEQIIPYLQSILQILSHSWLKDFIFLITGGLIGFLSSYCIYRLNEKKKLQNTLEEIIIEINILSEELRHTIYAIRSNNYLRQYYSLDTQFKIASNSYNYENGGIFQATSEKFESRVKEWELLSARLKGLIARHDLYIQKDKAIDEKFKKLKEFNVAGDYFPNIKSHDELKKKWDSNFGKTIMNEMTNEFEPILYELMNTIINSINLKLKKS